MAQVVSEQRGAAFEEVCQPRAHAPSRPAAPEAPRRSRTAHAHPTERLRSGAAVLTVKRTALPEECATMSTDRASPPPDAAAANKPALPSQARTDGLAVSVQEWLEDQTEKRVDEIEMLGEEE